MDETDNATERAPLTDVERALAWNGDRLREAADIEAGVPRSGCIQAPA